VTPLSSIVPRVRHHLRERWILGNTALGVSHHPADRLLKSRVGVLPLCYNASMGLARVVIGLLLFTWVVCFIAFVVAGNLAFMSGTTYEYMLFGVQFPFPAAVLLLYMATS
jgi:hypothetical protein